MCLVWGLTWAMSQRAPEPPTCLGREPAARLGVCRRTWVTSVLQAGGTREDTEATGVSDHHTPPKARPGPRLPRSSGLIPTAKVAQGGGSASYGAKRHVPGASAQLFVRSFLKMLNVFELAIVAHWCKIQNVRKGVCVVRTSSPSPSISDSSLVAGHQCTRFLGDLSRERSFDLAEQTHL